MIIYSHRAILDSNNLKTQENHPYAVDFAITAGFHVEIDIRVFGQDFYLGHDNPDYKVDIEWILERKSLLLLHCKNISAAEKLFGFNSEYSPLEYFCHSSADYSLTSLGRIWCHNVNIDLSPNCIIPLITEKDIEKYKNNDKIKKAAGIVTDFPILAAKIWN